MFTVCALISCNVYALYFPFFGVISNIIIIVIYTSLMKTDNLAPTYILLALVDGGCCLLTLLSCLCFAFEFGFPLPSANLAAFSSLLFYYLRKSFKAMSVLVVLHMAVMLCLTIISPLKFDLRLTRNRCKVTNMLIIVFTLAFFLPVLTTFRLHSNFDHAHNTTHLELFFPKNYQEVRTFLFCITDILFPVVAVFVSPAIFSFFSLILKKSAQFRKHHSGPPMIAKHSVSRNAVPSNLDLFMQRTDNVIALKTTILTVKYAKPVKTVAILTIVSSLCGLAALVLVIIRLLKRDLFISESRVELEILFGTLSDIMCLIGADAKMFIYRYVNVKFRHALVSLAQRHFQCRIKTRVI